MPSWKKLVVSGSDARVATLFTSGHLTSSGNISGSLTGSFRKIVTDDINSLILDINRYRVYTINKIPKSPHPKKS